jgi:hypothetical protein
MSTWHQRKNPVPLYSKDTWNVVVDPPNGCTGIMKFNDEKSAREYAGKVKHAYVLPPSDQIKKG